MLSKACYVYKFCPILLKKIKIKNLSPIGSRKHILSNKISLYFHFPKELNLTKVGFEKPENDCLNMPSGST